MAKLKAPLFSLGASGSIGEALVFFPWKGLHCVRTHVVPANPNTDAQQDQRGYMTDIVDFIHVCQALAGRPLDADDVIAYAALASTEATPRTWFNQLCKQGIDQLKDANHAMIGCDGTTTPAADSLVCDMVTNVDGTPAVTNGTFFWGVSKTALIHSHDVVVVASIPAYTIPGLVTGVKYFWQFRPTLPAEYVGCRSGIYYGTPD